MLEENGDQKRQLATRHNFSEALTSSLMVWITFPDAITLNIAL